MVRIKQCKNCSVTADNEFAVINLFIHNRKLCKNCYKLRQKNYRIINKEYFSEYRKKYYLDNKDKLNEYNLSYYILNKDKIRQINRIYYFSHKDFLTKYNKNYRLLYKSEIQNQRKFYRIKNRNKIALANKKYYISNKQKICEHNKNYYKHNKIILRNKSAIYYKNNKLKIGKLNYKRKLLRLQTDFLFKLRESVSSSIRIALKKKKNGKSFTKFLPYSMKELRQYLESRFESWMSWNNWGNYRISKWNDNDQSTWTWQLDHIIPQSDLPYTNMKDVNFKKCWALNNLRPLNAKQNILDGVNRTRHNKNGV